MRKRKVRVILMSLSLVVAAMTFTSGCSLLKKDGQTEPQTQMETQPVTETEKMTETQPVTETETETELQTNVAYTSQDKTIRITLPDSTWRVTQDADEMRVFSSGSAAMINIVHAADATAMKTISVADSEETLRTSLTKQYPEANSFDVVEFKKLSSSSLDTYEYVVKYNSTSMWAYSITYGILAKDEAYVITGTVTDDNKVLMEAVKKAVESFTVLRNAKFSAIPGSVVNQSESQTAQSESSTSIEAELKSLTDYGTQAKLYASEVVNIRLQPSTESAVLGSLNGGDEVTVVGETAQWFKVNINGNIGYINKAYLVNTPNQKETTQTTQTETSQTDASNDTRVTAELNSYVDYGTAYTYYTTTDVNLRAQPGMESGVVTTFGGGTSVQVIGETDNWFVVYANGATGYISKSYVSSDSSYEPGTTDPGQNPGQGSGQTPGGNTGVGTISGTIESATMNSLTIRGDDGNVYYVNYTDAEVSSQDGIYAGIYVTATIDYSGTLPSGELYATSVSGN